MNSSLRLDAAPSAPIAKPAAPKAPGGSFRKLTAAERARRPRLTVKLERLRTRLDRLETPVPDPVGDAFHLGRVGGSGGRALTRLNRQREAAFDKVIDNAVGADDLRREIGVLELRIKTIDTEQERSEQAAQSGARLEDQTKIYAAGFRTLVKVGDVVLLRCNSSQLTATRLNTKTVSTESGSKWDYLDLAPLRAGDEISVTEIMEAGRKKVEKSHKHLDTP